MDFLAEPSDWNRNFGGDDDDISVEDVEEEESPSSVRESFEIKWEKQPSQTELFVISIGFTSSTFLDSVLETKQSPSSSSALVRLGSIISSNDPKSSSKSSKSVPATDLFAFNKSVFCLNWLPVSSDSAFEFSELILKEIKPKYVLILDSLNNSLYVEPNQHSAVEPPLLRKLVTSLVFDFERRNQDEKKSKSRKDTEIVCPSLSPPNIVYSLGAAFLQSCDRQKIPSSLFLALYNQHFLSESIQPYERIFLSSSLQQQIKDLTKSDSSSIDETFSFFFQKLSGKEAKQRKQNYEERLAHFLDHVLSSLDGLTRSRLNCFAASSTHFMPSLSSPLPDNLYI